VASSIDFTRFYKGIMSAEVATQTECNCSIFITFPYTSYIEISKY